MIRIERFIAKIIEINNEEDDLTVIGFAQNKSFDKFINIQYTPNQDEQDLKFGWSKYFLEISNHSFDGYNSISKLNLTRNKLQIELAAIALEKTKIKMVEIEFQIEESKFEKLKNLIEMILD
jgi:hypothetical protein